MARRFRLREIAAERGYPTVSALMGDMLLKHNSDRVIAEDLGVHINTVKRWRRQNGVRRAYVVEGRRT